MKIKKGMRFKSNTSKLIIEITGKYNNNGHWNTKKLHSRNNHRIRVTTLMRHYTLIEENK